MNDQRIWYSLQENHRLQLTNRQKSNDVNFLKWFSIINKYVKHEGKVSSKKESNIHVTRHSKGWHPIPRLYENAVRQAIPSTHFKVNIERNHNLLEDPAECLCGWLFFSLFWVKALPLIMEIRSKSASSLLTGLAWEQWERMYTIMKQNMTFSECSSHSSNKQTDSVKQPSSKWYHSPLLLPRLNKCTMSKHFCK